ncbi:WhiB family transcriptional regulator [Schaalia sp. JY-X169]|uniref:WhiB family transcriptional regulator n=1 Tax=Schaalia sp. JY-X169 TaxID=2758572 RepID=UPI0015F486A4
MSGRASGSKQAADLARAEAHAQLLEHLAWLEEDGRQIPCRGPRKDLWISDHPASHRQASKACQACPALAHCAAYASEHETHRAGTWAGLKGKTERPPTKTPAPRRNAA